MTNRLAIAMKEYHKMDLSAQSSFVQGALWLLENLERLAHTGDHGPAKFRHRLELVAQIKDFVYEEKDSKI